MKDSVRPEYLREEALKPGDEHTDMVKPLAINRCQDGPARSATGLAVICAAHVVADFVRPAVVRGAGIAGGLDFLERLRSSSIRC